MLSWKFVTKPIINTARTRWRCHWRNRNNILTVCSTSVEWTTADICFGSFWNPASWIGARATMCNLLSVRSRAVLLWAVEPSGTWIASLVYICRTSVLCPNEAWLENGDEKSFRFGYNGTRRKSIVSSPIFNSPKCAWCGSAICTRAPSFLLYKIFTRNTSPYTPRCGKWKRNYLKKKGIVKKYCVGGIIKKKKKSKF